MAEWLPVGDVLIYAIRKGKRHHVIIGIDKMCYASGGRTVSEILQFGVDRTREQDEGGRNADGGVERTGEAR